mmetsp:Transcript_17931/g.36199  ORF Transcript_17931/g.36199 Transcript_17931/m.36199 type:complete len:469 (-) Transcript_17931:870-2276(-)
MSTLHSGKHATHVSKSGRTTKSTKPGCDLVTPGLSRSMRNETFMVRSFSTSPWRHISSSRRSDHAICTSCTAYRCPMSATLIAPWRTRALSASGGSSPISSSGFSSRLSRSDLSFDTIAMCSAMSVARTMSMTILRRLCCWARGMRWMKLFSSSRRMRNADDRWWCSLGDLSLESMAQSSRFLIRKSLLKPLCSKSCTHAAISPASSSSRPTNLPSPPLVSRQCIDCTTSATCVALWYGLSWCPISIARRKFTSFTWSRLNSSMRLCLRKTCHDSTWSGRPSASRSRSKTLKAQSLAFSRHCRRPLSWMVRVLRLVDSVDTELSSDRGLPDSDRPSGRAPLSAGCALKLSPKSSPRSTISEPATSLSCCCISSLVVCCDISIRPSSPSTLRRLVTSWCEIMIMGSPVTGSLCRCANTRQYHRESCPSSPRRRIRRSTWNVDWSSVSASIMLSYAVLRSVRSNPNEPAG